MSLMSLAAGSYETYESYEWGSRLTNMGSSSRNVMHAIRNESLLHDYYKYKPSRSQAQYIQASRKAMHPSKASQVKSVSDTEGMHMTS
jgi:hypothetical protein